MTSWGYEDCDYCRKHAEIIHVSGINRCIGDCSVRNLHTHEVTGSKTKFYCICRYYVLKIDYVIKTWVEFIWLLISTVNTPVSRYDEVTFLCRCSSVSEARKVFIYVSGGTDAAWDAQWSPYLLIECYINWINIDLLICLILSMYMK